MQYFHCICSWEFIHAIFFSFLSDFLTVSFLLLFSSFFSLKLYFIYSIIYDHYIKVYFLSFACLPRLQFSVNNNILGFASFR